MNPDEYVRRKKEGTVKLVKVGITGQVFYTVKKFDPETGKELDPQTGQVDKQNIVNQQTSYQNQISNIQASIENCKTFIKDIDALVPISDVVTEVVV